MKMEQGSRKKENREQEEGFQRAVEQGRVQGHDEDDGCHWGSTSRYFHLKGVGTGRVEQFKLVNWLTAVETKRGSRLEFHQDWTPCLS